MQDFGLLQNKFPGVSTPTYFLQPLNTHFLQVIFNIESDHLGKRK